MTPPRECRYHGAAMADSYREITPELARRIRLVMADVDGTILSGGGPVSPVVKQAIRRLQDSGITAGLVSGRTLTSLEPRARELGVVGPIIAENGAVARVQVDGELLAMGYSREPALVAFEKLKALFPAAIEAREDNDEHMIDVVIVPDRLTVEELRKHVEGVELYQLTLSSRSVHLVQKGVSKGSALTRLLGKVGEGGVSPEETMVFGDSLTDMSLFEHFPYSVLVRNPGVADEERQMLEKAARYVSDLAVEEGFAEVVSHVLRACGAGARGRLRQDS